MGYFGVRRPGLDWLRTLCYVTAGAGVVCIEITSRSMLTLGISRRSRKHQKQECSGEKFFHAMNLA